MQEIISKIKSNPLIFLFYLLMYILFFVELIINIKSLYLWNDESFTFHIIHHDFLNIMKLTSQDVHPFLYYFIAKVFILPFKSIFVQIRILRLVSAIPYLILLLVGNITIRHNFSIKVSLLFMFSIITMPLLVQDMYQVRMYGWAVLFTTITFLLFLYVYYGIISNSIHVFILISLFSLLGAYTHYYSLITIVVIYVSFLCMYILQGIKIRNYLLSIVIDIIAYFPWLKILLNQTKSVSDNYWTPPLTIKNVIKLCLNIVSPNYNKIFLLLSSMFLILIGFVMLHTLRLKLLPIYIGILLPFIVIFVGIILSAFIGHTVLILRYIGPDMGIFWLSIILMLFNVSYRYNYINWIILGLLLLIGTISCGFEVNQSYSYGRQFDLTLEKYKNIPKNSEIFYNSPVVMYSSSSYLNRNYLLSRINYKHTWMKIYSKVFNNINYKRNINDKHARYLIFNHRNISNNTILGKNFFNKYKYKLYKEGNIYLPLDSGKSSLYKIRNK